MGQRNRYQPFEERFILFSNKIEMLLKKLVIFFVIILFISQFLLSLNFIRNTLVPIERIEGALTFQIDFT